MIRTRCEPCVVVLLAALPALIAVPGMAADAQRDDGKRASLSLRATPSAGFSPLTVRFTVDVRGGADDAEDLYCPTVEWDWGDDQKSQASQDCDPYEPGKSQITRRYTTSRTFRLSGSYNVRFRLKQGDRVVANAGTTVQVRPGIRDDDFGN